MEENFERAERVKEAMKGRPISWLAVQVGVALSTAHSYMQGRIPPADIALRVAEILEIDIKWYINGTKREVVLDDEIKGLTKVPLIDNSFNNLDGIDYPTELLLSLFQQFSDIRCMIPTGNAMRPTIPENSEILFIPMLDSPEDGKVYILDIGDRAVIRRAMRMTNGQWRVVCDNPAFRGEEKDIISEKNFVGEVIWVSHRP